MRHFRMYPSAFMLALFLSVPILTLFFSLYPSPDLWSNCMCVDLEWSECFLSAPWHICQRLPNPASHWITKAAVSVGFWCCWGVYSWYWCWFFVLFWSIQRKATQTKKRKEYKYLSSQVTVCNLYLYSYSKNSTFFPLTNHKRLAHGTKVIMTLKNYSQVLSVSSPSRNFHGWKIPHIYQLWLIRWNFSDWSILQHVMFVYNLC